VVHTVLRVYGGHGRPAALHALPSRSVPAQTIPVLGADGRTVVEGGAEPAGGGVAGCRWHLCWVGGGVFIRLCVCNFATMKLLEVISIYVIFG